LVLRRYGLKRSGRLPLWEVSADDFEHKIVEDEEKTLQSFFRASQRGNLPLLL